MHSALIKLFNKTMLPKLMFYIGLELCESSIEEVPNRECRLPLAPLAIKTNELHTIYSACSQLKPFSKLNLLWIEQKEKGGVE